MEIDVIEISDTDSEDEPLISPAKKLAVFEHASPSVNLSSTPEAKQLRRTQSVFSTRRRRRASLKGRKPKKLNDKHEVVSKRFLEHYMTGLVLSAASTGDALSLVDAVEQYFLLCDSHQVTECGR